jgi:hypothetical protein
MATRNQNHAWGQIWSLSNPLIWGFPGTDLQRAYHRESGEWICSSEQVLIMKTSAEFIANPVTGLWFVFYNELVRFLRLNVTLHTSIKSFRYNPQ